MKKIYFLLCILTAHLAYTREFPETVTVAILVKDKAHTLHEYLECIWNQTYPKHLMRIYIRTNNNTDDSAKILKEWANKVKDKYLEIYFDDTDVSEPVQQYKQHEWNSTRFKVLGKIRQESAEWAKARGSHYFVADCDNFIQRDVIQTLLDTGLPIVAPFLTRDATTCYSNYHSHIDENGYFEGDPMYYQIFRQEVTGLIEVPVVHCTYLIRREALAAVCYDDDSYRYEYVIFSDCARKFGVQQYLDNRRVYGRITMAEDRASFINEPWYQEVLTY